MGFWVFFVFAVVLVLFFVAIFIGIGYHFDCTIEKNFFFVLTSESHKNEGQRSIFQNVPIGLKMYICDRQRVLNIPINAHVVVCDLEGQI